MNLDDLRVFWRELSNLWALTVVRDRAGMISDSRVCSDARGAAKSSRVVANHASAKDAERSLAVMQAERPVRVDASPPPGNLMGAEVDAHPLFAK